MYSSHHSRTFGAIMLRIAYGYEAQEGNDRFIDLADRCIDAFAKTTVPGAFLVDLVPILKYVPEWFPGAGFQRKAREWKLLVDELGIRPYEFVKGQMVAGTASKSYTSDLLEDRISDLSKEEADIIRWSANSLFGGGSDTTVSAMYSLFLAMTLYPNVQKVAQAEIDAIVGFDRLPSFSDRDSLPYIEALVKEVLRWHVAGPLGFAHCASEDDIHHGYYIPKGSLVIPNVWWVIFLITAFMANLGAIGLCFMTPLLIPIPWSSSQNVSLHARVNNLRTTLVLALASEDGQFVLPLDINFTNYGPRASISVCPGQRHIFCRIAINLTTCYDFLALLLPGVHLAEASLWMMAVTTLAVFNISKTVEDGVEITPQVDPSSQMISHPKPFKCCIKPRSPQALELIQQDV
ncbi:hypothetical protein ID866_9777 [Astraeus odoratus]|nr:hypothetical protein ID866_9777 [Astraeus odoratus]